MGRAEIGAGITKTHLAFYAFFLAGFIALGYLAHQNYLFPGEIAISRWLQSLDWPPFHTTMLTLSFLGEAISAAVIVIVVAVWLFLTRRRLEAIFAAALTGSASLTGWLLKLLIARPRPGDGTETTGFPSGHTLFAMTFYGFLFYLTPRLTQSRITTMVLRAGLALVIILTGISRIHLNEHWPVDVLGSLILGGLFLAPAVILYQAHTRDESVPIGASTNRDK